jgi:adenine-specific DNA methylase
MSEPKKLIEVAIPIKEISSECVRDKSIRHGHISTLHLWWARRPLPVCRAVVFASLVPDPLDPNCPIQFKDAIKIILGKGNNPNDPYKPYDDIPYTSAIDKMDDNERNRLMMFIGKYSNKFIENEKLGRSTSAKDQLSDFSLIKWDNKNNKNILDKARKLIWVAYNSKGNNAVDEILEDYENHINSINKAEKELYKFTNRHIGCEVVSELENNLKISVHSFLKKMPKVFDPFAGGGAIPLEAARLGCNSFGNDINPVAHVIQRGSLEFPQRFGKPIKYSKNEFLELYGVDYWNKKVSSGEMFFDENNIEIKNRLSFDVEFYCNKLLTNTEKRVGYLYPGNKQKAIAYYWVHEATCKNPTCLAKVPLMREFYLCDKPDKKIFFKPIFSGKEISFSIENGKHDIDDWIQRKNLKCPICQNITEISELKRQFNNRETSIRLIGVIEEGLNSKNYRTPTKEELNILEKLPSEIEFPSENLPEGNNRDLHCMGWGVKTWGDIFTKRQIVFLNTLVEEYNKLLENDISEYDLALKTYLAIFIDRISVSNTNLGGWHKGRETLERIMGRQALPMVFDFPESIPFSESTGSAKNQLDWIIRYKESESSNEFYTQCNNASSGDKYQFSPKELAAVITDPPYYDAIAYADLSDFFYVWLKRTLNKVFPLNFSTPYTPKTDECTALRHHHNNSIDEAKVHFENKLLQIFDAIEFQTSDIVSIMFAHQSTEAWSTLCNSILGARMNITGSWALDTEYNFTGLKAGKSFLASSVTVSAKPSSKNGIGSYKDVKKAIESKVAVEVDELYRLGFRGADLLTACFGQAVSEFGKFNRVEKADGSDVTVTDLLEMARESAFNALLKGFAGDEFTKFYIGWLQLNSFSISDYDDAVRFTRVGLSIEVQDITKENILIQDGNKQVLATYKDRISRNSKLGDQKQSTLIDISHRLMHLYNSPIRTNLLKFIEIHASDNESPVWRVITSLAELLPKDMEDYKLVVGLLTNKEQLIREAKSSIAPKTEQSKLIFE